MCIILPTCLWPGVHAAPDEQPLASSGFSQDCAGGRDHSGLMGRGSAVTVSIVVVLLFGNVFLSYFIIFLYIFSQFCIVRVCFLSYLVIFLVFFCNFCHLYIMFWLFFERICHLWLFFCPLWSQGQCCSLIIRKFHDQILKFCIEFACSCVLPQSKCMCVWAGWSL